MVEQDVQAILDMTRNAKQWRSYDLILNGYIDSQIPTQDAGGHPIVHKVDPMYLMEAAARAAAWEWILDQQTKKLEQNKRQKDRR